MYVVYDLETTGFSSSTCEVIQMAYVKFDDDGKALDSDSLYFYHEGMHWSQEAADASHHLSLDFLKQYKDDFRKNLIKAWTVLSGQKLVGYNNRKFDDPFISNWFQRMGLPALQEQECIDCMADMSSLYHTSRIKLTKACDMMGLTPDAILERAKQLFPREAAKLTAHNAAYDVAATSMLAEVGKKYRLILMPPQVKYEATEEDIIGSDNSPTVDFQKYHVLHLALYDGKEFVGYVNTSSDLKAEPSVNSENAPDIMNLVHAPFRLAPDLTYKAQIGDITFTLNREPNTVHIVGTMDGIVVDSNDMNVLAFAQKN